MYIYIYIYMPPRGWKIIIVTTTWKPIVMQIVVMITSNVKYGNDSRERTNRTIIVITALVPIVIQMVVTMIIIIMTIIYSSHVCSNKQ